MSVSQLKRGLWAMNEILSASTPGISREELSDRWAYSSMNDDKEEGIPERTFHRIHHSLESVFEVQSIARKLRRVPFEYGLQLIDSAENGNIAGADCAEWDAGYKRYVCVWNDNDYKRTDLWLSIGIDYDHVFFYVVTSIQDAAYREKISQLMGLDNGEQHMYGYWWYEPVDKSLFQFDFQTFPDMQEVKRRVEMLIAKIAALPEDIHKPAK